MRMRQHIHRWGGCRRHLHRAGMIHKDKRAYHAAHTKGKDTAHIKSGSKGGLAGFYDYVEHVIKLAHSVPTGGFADQKSPVNAGRK